ncbi:hypothetical protein AYI70_g1983 [Smittium culicis]|uniref:Uncharacterized protein n=1 Tax=Smittium culicis TaxID=133412 RepID=A0A1R1YAD0_9FUNG|nr:hypothetical protein AYI70_g1983 [Smittium culicis]
MKIVVKISPNPLQRLLDSLNIDRKSIPIHNTKDAEINKISPIPAYNPFHDITKSSISLENDSIAFKNKVESIRKEVGSSWLRVFSEIKSGEDIQPSSISADNISVNLAQSNTEITSLPNIKYASHNERSGSYNEKNNYKYNQAKKFVDIDSKPFKNNHSSMENCIIKDAVLMELKENSEKALSHDSDLKAKHFGDSADYIAPIEQPIPYFLFPKKSGKLNGNFYSNSSIDKAFSKRKSNLSNWSKPSYPEISHTNELLERAEKFPVSLISNKKSLVFDEKSSDKDNTTKKETNAFPNYEKDEKSLIKPDYSTDIPFSLNRYTISWADLDFPYDEKSLDSSSSIQNKSLRYSTKLKLNVDSCTRFSARMSLVSDNYLLITSMKNSLKNELKKNKISKKTPGGLRIKKSELLSRLVSQSKAEYEVIGSYKVSGFTKAIYFKGKTIDDCFKESSCIILEYKPDVLSYPEWLVLSFPKDLIKKFNQSARKSVITKDSKNIHPNNSNNTDAKNSDEFIDKNRLKNESAGSTLLKTSQKISSPGLENSNSDLSETENPDIKPIKDVLVSFSKFNDLVSKIQYSTSDREGMYKKMYCITCGWSGIADQLYYFIDKIIEHESSKNKIKKNRSEIDFKKIENIDLTKSFVCMKCGSNYLVDFENNAVDSESKVEAENIENSIIDNGPLPLNKKLLITNSTHEVKDTDIYLEKKKNIIANEDASFDLIDPKFESQNISSLLSQAVSIFPRSYTSSRSLKFYSKRFKIEKYQNTLPLQSLSSPIKLMMELSFFSSKDEKIKQWSPCGIIEQKVQSLYTSFKESNSKDLESLASLMINPDLTEVPSYLALSNKNIYFFSPNSNFWNLLLKSSNAKAPPKAKSSIHRKNSSKLGSSIKNKYDEIMNSNSAFKLASKTINLSPFNFLNLVKVISLNEILKIDVCPNRQYLVFHFDLFNELPSLLDSKIHNSTGIERKNPDNTPGTEDFQIEGTKSVENADSSSSKGWITPFLPRFILRNSSTQNNYHTKNENAKVKDLIKLFDSTSSEQIPVQNPTETQLSNHDCSENIENSIEANQLKDKDDNDIDNAFKTGSLGSSELIPGDSDIATINRAVSNDPSVNINSSNINATSSIYSRKHCHKVCTDNIPTDNISEFKESLLKFSSHDPKKNSIVLMLRNRLTCSDWLDSIQEIFYYERENDSGGIKNYINTNGTKLINHDIEWAMHHLKHTVFLSENTFKCLDSVSDFKNALNQSSSKSILELSSKSKIKGQIDDIKSDNDAAKMTPSECPNNHSTVDSNNDIENFQLSPESVPEYQGNLFKQTEIYQPSKKSFNYHKYKDFSLWDGFINEKICSLSRLKKELNFFKTFGNSGLATIDPNSDRSVVIDKVTYEFLKLYFSVGWIPEYFYDTLTESKDMNTKNKKIISSKQKNSASSFSFYSPLDASRLFYGVAPRTIVATSYYIYLVRERLDVWPPPITNLIKFYENFQTEKPPMIVTSNPTDYNHLTITSTYMDRITGTLFNPMSLLSPGLSEKKQDTNTSPNPGNDNLIKNSEGSKISPKPSPLDSHHSKDSVNDCNIDSEIPGKLENNSKNVSDLEMSPSFPRICYNSDGKNQHISSDSKLSSTFAVDMKEKVANSFWAAESIDQYDQIERVCPVICIESLSLGIINSFSFPREYIKNTPNSNNMANNESFQDFDLLRERLGPIENKSDLNHNKSQSYPLESNITIQTLENNSLSENNLDLTTSLSSNDDSISENESNNDRIFKNKTIRDEALTNITSNENYSQNFNISSKKKDIFGITAAGWQAVVTMSFNPKFLNSLTSNNSDTETARETEKSNNKISSMDNVSPSHSNFDRLSHPVDKERVKHAELKWRLFFSSVNSAHEFIESVVGLVLNVSNGKRKIEPMVFELNDTTNI